MGPGCTLLTRKGRKRNQEKHLPELVSQEDKDLVASRGDGAFRAPSSTDAEQRGQADPLRHGVLTDGDETAQGRE